MEQTQMGTENKVVKSIFIKAAEAAEKKTKDTAAFVKANPVETAITAGAGFAAALVLDAIIN